jgi:hypothetical protein
MALGWQTCAEASHHCAAVQSASTLQPVAARQVPLAEQVPLRHTPGLCAVQGPSPFA